MHEWQMKALDTYVRSWLGARDETVLRHGYLSANRALGWWEAQLRANHMPNLHLTPDPTSRDSEYLSREDLFLMAQQPGVLEDDEGLLRFLWHVVWWGSGAKHSRVAPKIRAFADPAVRASHLAILREALGLARGNNLAEAYRVLQPGSRAQIPQMGPSYFTKFLYFATGGEGPLILDRQVVLHLRAFESPLAINSRLMSATGYATYCCALDDWAKELTTTERRVQADELERALFAGRERNEI